MSLCGSSKFYPYKNMPHHSNPWLGQLNVWLRITPIFWIIILKLSNIYVLAIYRLLILSISYLLTKKFSNLYAQDIPY